MSGFLPFAIFVVNLNEPCLTWSDSVISSGVIAMFVAPLCSFLCFEMVIAENLCEFIH